MKWLLFVIFVSTLTACGVRGPGEEVSCDAMATCQHGTEHVSSCDGHEKCTTESICGTVAYCVPSEIRAEDYTNSCETDADCVSINEGDPCACHVCPDAAINTNSQSLLDEAVAAHMCDVSQHCPDVECGEELLPRCNEGTCELQMAE